MAEAEVQVRETGPDLKYLGFIPALVLKVIAYITCLYEFVKDNSGPLKPGINKVEGTGKRVVGLVYQKIYWKPEEILAFVDRKVDVAVQSMDGVLPPSVKQLSFKVYDGTKSTLAKAQKDGIYCTAKYFFDKYEPVAESYGIKAYKKALTIPLVPEVVALTRYGAVKVNAVIVTLKNGGLPLASYVPLLPVGYFDKITRSE